MRRAYATIEALFDEAKEADESTRADFRKFALKSQERKNLLSMVGLAQHLYDVVLSPDKLDADPMLLGLLNGTVRSPRGLHFEAMRCGV